MRKNILLAAILIVLAGAAGWMWIRHGSEMMSAKTPEGYNMVCKFDDCRHHYVIPRAEFRNYPRGERGEGFHCPKCGRNGGLAGTYCDQCNQWSISSTLGSNPCPYCAGADSAEAASAHSP